MDPVQREKELIKMELPRTRVLVTTSRADYVDHTERAVYNPPIKKTQSTQYLPLIASVYKSFSLGWSIECEMSQDKKKA